jgi:hypothetical protein
MHFFSGLTSKLFPIMRLTSTFHTVVNFPTIYDDIRGKYDGMFITDVKRIHQIGSA